MKRRTLFALPLAACGRGGARLNVFNWSGYFAPDTLSNFERETGIRIRLGLYESGEEMLARVMSGNSGWDVVFPSNSLIHPMREMNLLARLDHARLPNLDRLDAMFQRPVWDATLDYSVPYMWGATGIAYQRSLDPPPQRWSDLWTARLAGRLTMLDDPADVFGACLKLRGRSVNEASESALRQARADAIDQKQYVRAYLNAEARDQLVAGDLLAAQAWRMEAQQAIDASSGRVTFCYPEEGYPIYADCAAILRESQRTEAAHAFINYLLRPPVAASIAIAMRTAPCNGGARELLPEALRSSPVYFPPPETLQRGEWLAPLDAATQRLRDRLWTEIKSA